MDIITSRANKLITECAKLSLKKHRDEKGLFFFEGVKLFEEALISGIEIKYVFITEKMYPNIKDKLTNLDFYVVSDSVYEKLSAEKSPQGVICIAKYIDKSDKFTTIYNMDEIFKVNNPERCARFFVLESIRDPGNLGTVMRSALAFGIDYLILSSDCADIYSNKTVRASMGAVFKLPIILSDNLVDTIEKLKTNGYSLYAALLDENSTPLNLLKTTPKTVFVVGNEGHGISDKTKVACGGSVYIPMCENTESLNATSAANVLMWEQYKNLLK